MMCKWTRHVLGVGVTSHPPHDIRKLTAYSHLSSLASLASSKCLHRFSDPVSPHIAARGSTGASDEEVRAGVYDELQRYAKHGEGAVAVVESAGGVLSPSPSGSPQADLYRPLRLSALLIGDHKLGGIGTTISAWESLHVRGYDVQAVGLFAEGRYQNYEYLQQYFAERNVACFSINPPPARAANHQDDLEAMSKYYGDASESREITAWTNNFLQKHDARIRKLRQMPSEANQSIWHPFLQHRERSEDTIVAMDSAHGDFFQTYTTQRNATCLQKDPLLQPAFDGSASWWTQGLGHGNPRLALTAAHAAGRYGHVMFASAIHEPALNLAQTLVQSSGNPRLSKVFYTDNGSTGMEVAVKMALRAACVRHGWSAEQQIDILGLTNSYHGDTIGTMDCSEPSVFNKKVEWYRGRGHWLDFPQVKMRRGRWMVENPMAGTSTEFDTLDDVFDFERRAKDSQRYRTHIDAELLRLRQQGIRLGALILEPIILGAGGMMFADPLFQRCLVQAVRALPSNKSEDSVNNSDSSLDWSGMPVIFDEVFTGLYRLGRFSAASFLGVDPDIVVNAKLLTGGLLPLCTTTASETVFNAFLSNDKSDALLHGHSYTAHAVGCAVANDSLKAMSELESGEQWKGFRDQWTTTTTDRSSISEPTVHGTDNSVIWSMWSHSFLQSISHKTSVDSVFAIGSVLAISLADPKGAGYASTAATGLRDRLLSGNASDEWVIHSRVLGNVMYLMASMTTSPATISEVQERVLQSL